MQLAKLIFFALISLTTVATLLVTVATAYNRFSFRSTGMPSSSESRLLYAAHCQRCHTLDGQPSTGPSLKDIAVTAAKRKEGLSAAEYIIESIANPGAYSAYEGLQMPQVSQLTRSGLAPLTDQQVRMLAEFLLRQNDPTSIESLSTLPVPRPVASPPKPPIRLSMIREGEEIFRGKGKCVTCHYPSSYIAPSLDGVGTNSLEYIREAILNPSKQIATKHRTSVVEVDGSAISGIIKAKDDKRVLMFLPTQADVQNRIANLKISDIDREPDGSLRIKDSPMSIMPSYKDSLTDHEVECLVELLRCLD
jgi:mono/diheme cytochrome c family protein